jgi:hypothetical protein
MPDLNKPKPLSLDDLKDGMSAEELANASPEPVEPKVEPKEEPVAKTEPKEEPAEPKEEPKVEPKEEPVEPKSDQFDFSFLNKSLNKNYESIDQIKADIEKPTMESEYNDVKTQLEEWQAKYNELNADYELLTDQIDPSSYFSSEEAMKLEAFKKANPDKDASIAQKIFATEDLSTIDDIEMVKMGWRFNTPNLKGTDKDLEEAIAEELGQDQDSPVSEWPVSAQNRLARMAADYTNQFKGLRSGVTLPDKLDIESLKTKRKEVAEKRIADLTEGWSKIADETLKNTKSVKLPIGKPAEGEDQKFFVWELGDPPKDEVEELKNRYISMGVDPKENKELFSQTLHLALVQKNISQMMQKYGEDLVANLEEKHLEETHNTNPIKDTERTELTEGERDAAERNQFAREIVGGGFTPNPLFKKKT